MSDLKVNIKIDNLAKFQKAFASSPYIVKPHLEKAIYKAILLVGRRSRQLTPVDTGRLRASTREIFKPLYGEVGTNVNYDIFVHEGTRYMKARPFLRNAVSEESSKIQPIFKEELQLALNKIARMT